MEHGIDLHIHTNKSDGKLSPREVVMLAKERRLRAIAITDHNTVAAIKECLDYGREFGVEVVPGSAEISVKNEEERSLKEIHMLGYFMDYEDGRLLDVLGKLNESKRVWLQNQVKVLNEAGYKAFENEIKEVAGPAVPSRPHVWAVVEKYNAGKIGREEFYNRTAFDGDLYVKKGFEIALEDCVALIKKVGGIPVLGHPGFYKTDEVVKLAVDAGVEGMEVYYSYAGAFGPKSKDVVKHVEDLAKKYGLLKTGGSDFHDVEHGVMLGSVDVPYRLLEEMKKRIA